MHIVEKAMKDKVDRLIAGRLKVLLDQLVVALGSSNPTLMELRRLLGR